MIRRHLRRILTAAAALTLLGVGVAVTLPANAATAMNDGFEGYPHVNWSMVEVRGSSMVYLNNTVERRSGTHAAWLIAGPTAAEAARIHRRVQLDKPSGQVECFGEMYMRKAGGQRTAQGPATVTVLLRRTIQEDSFWTNIFSVSDTSNYRLFSVGLFPYTPSFVLDISSVNDVLIDDVHFACRSIIR